MAYTPTAADVLASLAMGGAQGHPVIELTAALRRDATAARDAHPLMLVDVVRFLAILGERAVVHAIAEAVRARAEGAVHFELGLAALVFGETEAAEAHLQRAIAAAEPQPMAHNSLAVVRRDRGDLDGAWRAIARGLAAMPDDPVTRHTAVSLAILSGRDAEARELGFTGDAEALRREAARHPPVRGGLFPTQADLAVEASRKTMELAPALGSRAVDATRHLLERALRLHPNHPRARAGLAALPR